MVISRSAGPENTKLYFCYMKIHQKSQPDKFGALQVAVFVRRARTYENPLIGVILVPSALAR